MSPKLSICISTFNRAGFIGETLDCLIDQLTQDTEIVVLDGGSSDGTQDIMQRYARACPRLRYVRQDTNQGVDRDFDRAVELAAGEYCWLMSDDDLLIPGAVGRVLEALRRPYSLVIVNAEVRDNDLKRQILPRRLRFREDRIYGPTELDRLFAEAGTYLTFIGCVVIERRVWLTRDRQTYYGSLFIHVGVIFQRPLPGDTLVIAEPLISVRYGNAMWKPRDFEIWMFKWPALVWSLPGPSDEARTRVCAREPWRELARLVFFRAKGCYSLQEYRRWISPRAGSAARRLGALTIALLPGMLLNWAALLYLSVVRPDAIGKDAALGLYEIRNSPYYFRNRRKALANKRAPST
jgi:abequosyltransferase